MAKRDKPVSPIVRKTPCGIIPASAYDAERIMADGLNCEYDLVKRTRRSLPQLGLYWKMLDRIVGATGKWPTKEHLHAELKLALGYRMMVADWQTGEIATVPDSVAFDAMDADQFRSYFDRAIAELSRHLGYDPLAFYEEAA